MQRALEDGHCASEEEQGQEGKYLCKEERGERGLGQEGCREGEKDREKVKEIGLELRAKMMVAKGRKAEQLENIGSIQDTTAWRKSC